ncbi:MAG: response regulator [Coriobacteriia bacterium]|nr:response regulator [Coriobacteriia bacterium]
MSTLPDDTAELRALAEALSERVRILEAENDLLTERSEDMLLLGLIGEGLSAAESVQAVLEHGLERISLLKAIPLCACYALGPSGANPLAVHSAHSSRRVEPQSVPLFCQSLLIETRESVYLNGPDCADLIVELPGSRFRPTSILGMPVRRRDATSFLFVFADDSSDDHLASQSLLLHRLVDMMLARVDSLELMESLRHVNDELSGANDLLRQATQAKSAFLSLISHEIRTPMNAILGFAQLMAREPGITQQQRERLAIIDRNGEYLLALINDVLEMAKIESGRSTLRASTFDLAVMLADLDAIFRDRAHSAGIDLRVELTADLPRFVTTDKAKLRQVLVNLLGNAVKFTQTGSVTLEATAERSGEDTALTFIVTDTGVGVDESEIELMFEPFSQTESGRTMGTGTGLGLAISQQYVRLLGGELTATSSRGVGSRFEFTVCVEEGEADAAETPSAPERIRRAPDGGLRVLVADDFAEMRTLLSEMLTNLGYEVETASDGREALERFHAAPPDLVLLDMRMPIMGGLEVIREIRTGDVAPETPIVALTANAFVETRGELLDAGANDFLSKPCTETELADALGELLEPTPAATAPAREAVAGEPAAAPQHLIARVKRAAVMGDFDKVAALVDEVREFDSRLAEQLHGFAADYDADAIVDAFGR